MWSVRWWSRATLCAYIFISLKSPFTLHTLLYHLSGKRSIVKLYKKRGKNCARCTNREHSPPRSERPGKSHYENSRAFEMPLYLAMCGKASLFRKSIHLFVYWWNSQHHRHYYSRCYRMFQKDNLCKTFENLLYHICC